MKLEDRREQTTIPGRFLGKDSAARWELAAYVILIVLAAGLHFWDLGARALHHDESLHATYSWYLATGKGFRHDPMMHGPMLFDLTGLVYFLFGAGDYMARVMPALLGTVAVGLPVLLRRQLGRAGALVTAGLLTISPLFLYYSRFLREDIFMVVWTLLTVIFMWRYLDDRRPKNLYFLAAALAASFAQKETAFISMAIFGSFFLFVFLSDRASRLRLPGDLSIGSGAGQLLIVGATLVLPLWIGGLKLLEKLSGGAIVLPGGNDPNALLLWAPIFVVVVAVCAFAGTFWDRSLWPKLAVVFWAIYVVLYTTFLSNMNGLGTGIVGSLTYWVDQQGVRRGDQPGYYYYILLSIYEFLPVIVGLMATVYYLIKRNVFTSFLIYWTAASFVLYSVAGEKMPWLGVMMALPLVLLSGRFIGSLLVRIPWRQAGVSFYLSIAGAIAIVVFIAAYVVTWGSRVASGMDGRRELSASAVFIILFIALVAWLWSKMDTRLALKGLALAGLAILVVLTVRTSVRASFQNGDIPVEMAVYTQSSPDVPAVFRQIEQLAAQRTVGKSLSVLVDGTDGFTWPWAWYLRDYKNVLYVDLVNPAPPTADVVLVNSGNIEKVRPLLTGYNEIQRYRLRWWFPESLYRDVTFSKFFSALGDGSNWVQWIKYFYNRDLPESLGPNPLGSVDGYVFFKSSQPPRP